MVKPKTISFEFRTYPDGAKVFSNDFVAHLPGLLITQFAVDNNHSLSLAMNIDTTALRFDFLDDWYSVIAFLDGLNKPTGHYIINTQTPLICQDGMWKGDNLLLKLEVYRDWQYSILGEKDLISAVDDGWMMVNSAINARETIRKTCTMLDDRSLPQEVMDAVSI